MKYYTVRSLAAAFQLAEADVRTLARLGIIEGGRIGPSWVFDEDAFEILADLLDGDDVGVDVEDDDEDPDDDVDE